MNRNGVHQSILHNGEFDIFAEYNVEIISVVG